MGEINVGKRLPLFQKGRNKLIQFFQRFRRLIDTASAGMLQFFIGIIRILCPVKIKIMGAGSQLLTGVANVGRLRAAGISLGKSPDSKGNIVCCGIWNRWNGRSRVRINVSCRRKEDGYIQTDDGFYHPGNEGPESDGCGFLWR